MRTRRSRERVRSALDGCRYGEANRAPHRLVSRVRIRPDRVGLLGVEVETDEFVLSQRRGVHRSTSEESEVVGLE